MKTPILPFLLMLVMASIPNGLVAQNTEFTYQGRLTVDGQPANGVYDLRCNMYDAASNGNLIAGPLINAATHVQNGLFTARLDFGASVFSGRNRWVELAVRTNDNGIFGTLSPRQQLTPTPYALYSSSAGNSLLLDGQSASAFVARSGDTIAGTLRAGHLISDAGLAWGASMLGLDQGGNLELGGSLLTDTTPYLDFHFGVRSNQDYNVRIINSGRSQFEIDAEAFGAMLVLNPSVAWMRAEAVTFVSPNNVATMAVQNISGKVELNDLVVDMNGKNENGLTPGIQFGGMASGEAIASNRSAGANQFGLDFYTASLPRLSIANSGNIGINTTTPDAALSVNGTADKPGGGSWGVYSDIRLKKNIQPLRGALNRLLKLRAVTFEYNDPGTIHELSGSQIGMIAQEVENIFPDWVDTAPNGMKRLNIHGFEALTVEALRELQEEREAKEIGLQTANTTLREEIAELRHQLDASREVEHKIIARLVAIEGLVESSSPISVAVQTQFLEAK